MLIWINAAAYLFYLLQLREGNCDKSETPSSEEAVNANPCAFGENFLKISAADRSNFRVSNFYWSDF